MHGTCAGCQRGWDQDSTVTGEGCSVSAPGKCHLTCRTDTLVTPPEEGTGQ